MCDKGNCEWCQYNQRLVDQAKETGDSKLLGRATHELDQHKAKHDEENK